MPTEAGGGDGGEKRGTVILIALVESRKDQNTMSVPLSPQK